MLKDLRNEDISNNSDNNNNEEDVIKKKMRMKIKLI